MKRASYRLAYRDAQSVTDIAMDAGYDAPDAFARAFRATVRAIAVIVPEISRLGAVASAFGPPRSMRGASSCRRPLPLTT